MIVVLAEKPSVARDLAAVLGAKSRREGYLEGNGYQITWAFGHLVTLKEPDDYDPSLKRWNLDTLPIIPDEFALKLTGDDGAKAQYRIIAGLFADADELICATDAGREGELIFRYIQVMAGCTDKPFKRLWLSSLTEEAIRKGFQALADGREYDNLYAAARCRSEADWIVGMNATRNFTVRFGQNGVLWSVGRVQTPVLALIVGRDEEIRHFVPEPWFEVRTRYRKVLFKLLGDRFKAKADATAVAAAIREQPFEIQDIKVRKDRDLPPQLYDLTALQRDMNVRYGMAAADVLADTQKLYEQKFVTYPRTDSRYLPKDMHGEVVGVLRKLGEKHPSVARLDLARLPMDKRVFDDKKVSDHHAILPTGRAPSQVSATMQKIYDAVVQRTIAAFYPPCRKDVTTIQGQAGEHKFTARGVRVTDPGWTELYPKKKRKEDDADTATDQQELPEFVKGESGPHEPLVHESETRPPRHYTENSLLAAMETAGRLVEDDALKEALKARGLGTPATRANIIETLLRRRYIAREKKNLVATDLGRYLIALIRDEVLKSPEMTGEWEAKLRDIEAGQLDADAFMTEIEGFTRNVIDGSERRIDPTEFGPCPRCGGPIVEGRKGYGCSKWKDGCEFVLWREYEGMTIPARQARELLQLGLSTRPVRIADRPSVLALTRRGQPTHLAVPMREHQRGPSKKPKRQTARSKAATAPPRKKTTKKATKKAAKKKDAPITCPLCSGPLVEREEAFACAAWRSGCRFVIHKTIAGKKITKAMAKKLLTKGRTQVLKGFTSKSNKPFDARLKLEDGRVQFEFGD